MIDPLEASVLPRERRVSARSEFREILRGGVRASAGPVSVHLLPRPPGLLAALPGGRAGLVVSRAVGGSVVRHRTSRRLRHLLAARLCDLPAGSRLVVRAGPGAGSADSTVLGEALDHALGRALSAPRRRPRRAGG